MAITNPWKINVKLNQGAASGEGYPKPKVLKEIITEVGEGSSNQKPSMEKASLFSRTNIYK